MDTILENPELSALYRNARAEVYEELEKIKKSSVPTESNPTPPEGLPDCISHILTSMPKTDNSTFNKLILNLVTCLQRAGSHREAALEQVLPFLQNYPHSTQYTTPEDRQKHFTEEWDYIEKHPDYKFECGYIKGLRLPGTAFQCKSCSWCPEEAKVEKEHNVTSDEILTASGKPPLELLINCSCSQTINHTLHHPTMPYGRGFCSYLLPKPLYKSQRIKMNRQPIQIY
jgi:hypothetical protein